MIGRHGPVKPFELIRWARQQARHHDLRPLEAHGLLVLATYANQEALAWPSIRTLALDAGLSVSAKGGNSSISAALVRLEELRLIWRRQAGRGHPAKCELLFMPAKPSGTPEPSGTQEGSTVREGNTPSPPAGRSKPSGRQEAKYQRTTRVEGPEPQNLNGQMKPSARPEGFDQPPVRSRRRTALRPVRAALIDDFARREGEAA
jgi:hypothetical protein